MFLIKIFLLPIIISLLCHFHTIYTIFRPYSQFPLSPSQMCACSHFYREIRTIFFPLHVLPLAKYFFHYVFNSFTIFKDSSMYYTLQWTFAVHSCSDYFLLYTTGVTVYGPTCLINHILLDSLLVIFTHIFLKKIFMHTSYFWTEEWWWKSNFIRPIHLDALGSIQCLWGLFIPQWKKCGLSPLYIAFMIWSVLS